MPNASIGKAQVHADRGFEKAKTYVVAIPWF